jgi:hypothetical protein
MRRSPWVLFAAAGGVAVLGFATAAPASGAATTLLASWQMNEGAGATTMVDASGNGLHGTIGSAVQTGVAFDSSNLGYRWSKTNPNEAPAKPERLVTVNNSKLNPGTRDFAVTIRYRTTHSYGNIVQKGQAGSAGGYWKLQAPQGVLSCLFRGASGSRSVNAGVALNDGAWHTVRCERTATGVTMTIDGTRIRRATGATGNISNTAPLSIGGKYKCDQVKITCDYFSGDIDYLRVEVGS